MKRFECRVAETLKEMNASHHWVSKKGLKIECQRAFNESVNHQLVLCGVNVRDSVVVHTEMQSVRGDDVFLMLNGGMSERENLRTWIRVVNLSRDRLLMRWR